MLGRTTVGAHQGGTMVKKTCLLKLLLVLCCACFTGSQSASNQFHHTMSPRELTRVFQVSSHDQVPDYEVVRVEHVRKREVRSVSASPGDSSGEEDEKEVSLSAFGRSLKLRLKRNEAFNKKLSNFKVLEAESTDSGLRYHEVQPQKNESDIGESYQDDDNMAAVMLTEGEDGSISMVCHKILKQYKWQFAESKDGTIGNDLVIKPLVNTETDDSFIDDEMFLDEDDFKDRNATSSKNNRNMRYKAQRKIPKVTQPGSHVVYKRKQQQTHEHTDALSDYRTMEPGIFSNRTGNRRAKRQTQDTVWPEVLLIVDYDTFVLHGASSQEIKKYFVSFWNGVDLRYKLLTHPVIKVSLAGMIVAKDRDATPYLEQNRLRAPNGDAVDAAGALTDLGKYLYREDRLPTYDLAVVITKLDMCRRRFQGGRCNRGTAGFAYVGGACVVNKRLEKVNSVAIIEDSGGFSGIIVAAHEVGHLLGCVHDGSPPPSYLGGPGATRCPWEDGFIMSDLRHTERGFRWSSCSVEQFKHFLRGETATCLFNFPHENDLLPRQLPGTILTLDQQCKRDRGTTACFRDSRVCAQLFCFDSNSGYCVSYRPAAEGSPCGDGQVCRNGRCLTELENIIPDYTHVTQTFANRPPADIFARRSDTSSPTTTTTRGGSSVIPARGNSTGKPTVRIAQVYRRTSQQLQQPSKASRTGGSTSKPLKQEIAAKDCLDSAQNLGGSMSCKQFLEQFGERYCDHDYMKKHCCASHSEMCNKG